MARAKRHFIPGHIWHITHRCHNGKGGCGQPSVEMAFQRLQRDPGTPEEKCSDRLRAAPSDFRTESYNQLKTNHKRWVEEQLQGAVKKRQDEWAGGIAVGSNAFIENVKARLSFRARGRNVIETGEGYQLRENLSSYKALFGGENEDIDLKNTYFWDVN